MGQSMSANNFLDQTTNSLSNHDINNATSECPLGEKSDFCRYCSYDKEHISVSCSNCSNINIEVKKFMRCMSCDKTWCFDCTRCNNYCNCESAIIRQDSCNTVYMTLMMSHVNGRGQKIQFM